MISKIILSLLATLMLTPNLVSASSAVLARTLYTEKDWSLIETTEEGISIHVKPVSGVPVKAVRVSQILEIDPEVLAQVIEDVSNYGRFLTSASAMECDLLAVTETELVGYQYVDIPLISDRVYAFRMFRPDSASTRVDWELIPQSDLKNYQVNERSGVYIDYGVGSWSMNKRADGKYDVSYRLVMDPGGWIPDSVSDYFNQVSIVGIFKDAIKETERRSRPGKG
jgi:hypothetical protein